jgi:hypothetical protein
VRHPVQLQVERQEGASRIHVVVRLVLLVAVGAIGCGPVYWLAYLASPALVALAILRRGADRYLADDARRIARALRWLVSALAYLSLLTDTPPTREPGPIELEIEPGGTPTATSALLRLLTSLPALLLVVVLSTLASFCWVVGVVCILVSTRLPSLCRDYLTLTLRTQVRFLAYHLSVVDAYPSVHEDRLAHAAT